MVSVIIPTYNREKTIYRSIISVLNQTFSDIEVLVIDDCSTDDTGKIINSIDDPRVKYFKLKKRGGACIARNKGIEMAKGDYIAFQDSDDEWVSNKIELQLKTLKTYNADVVICAIRRHDYDKRIEKFPNLNDGFKSYKDILMGFYVSTQVIFGKKEVFDRYKFDDQMPRMQDYDIMIRIAKTEKIYYIDKALVDVYLQKDSISSKDNHAGKNEEVSSILLEKYQDVAKEYPEWKIEMLKRIIHNRVLQGKRCDNEINELYNMDPDISNLLQLILYKFKLLKYALLIKEKL